MIHMCRQGRMQDRHTSQDKGRQGQGQRDYYTNVRARHRQTQHKRMASTLHDCSSRLGDKGYRASNPLLVKRPARRAHPPIHPFRFPNGLALTRERAALDGERTMGGEAQGSVRLCRAHEEGPVKHFARPPFRAATPSHLTALRHWRTGLLLLCVRESLRRAA